jgi:hypothetical protein
MGRLERKGQGRERVMEKERDCEWERREKSLRNFLRLFLLDYNVVI